MREIQSSMSAEATGQTVAREEVNTDEIVESDGGASCRLEQSQLHSMTVSLNRGDTTTTATVQRVRPRWITNTVESGIDGGRTVARHQAEQADVKLPIETMKSSANIIDDVSCQYEQYTGKLWDRDKCVAKHCGVLRQGNEYETIDEIHVRTTTILFDEVDVKHWKIVSSGGVNQHERYRSFGDTQASKEVPMLTTRTTDQSPTEYGHRKNTTILDTSIVFLHSFNSHRHGRIDSCTSTKSN